MDNQYKFAAIRGMQAGRAFYVAMIPLAMVERLFRYEGRGLAPEHRVQRDLNKTRIPSIARYITENANDYVLSPLSASIDGAFSFEPVAGERSVGTLAIDMGATLLLNDGQHRRAGIVEGLRQRPHLGRDTIAVTLFPDEGLERSQQMFVDLNQHGVKPARSLRLFYDRRNDGAGLSRAVVRAIPLLLDLVDFTRSSISAKSPKLFAFSNVHTATVTLVNATGIPATPENPTVIVEFWEQVVANMPDWLAAARGEVCPSQLRREMVHAHGIALEAIAIAGARAINEAPFTWREVLRGLQRIDWSRTNSNLWEGRALMGGRVNRSRTSILLTAELLSRWLLPHAADGAQGVH